MVIHYFDQLEYFVFNCVVIIAVFFFVYNSIYVSYPVMYVISNFFCNTDSPIDSIDSIGYNTYHVVSKLVYHFGAIVKAARNAEIVLKVPVDFPIELKDFQDKSLALSNKSFNNGNGLSLVEMMEVIQLNKESIATVLGEESAYGLAIIEDIARFKASCKVEHDEGMYFLCVYRSIEAKISCVYGIVKDV